MISTDTVWFDTVFTRVPNGKYPISVTKIFSIRNTENKTVNASIDLVGGKNSQFSFAVDGVQGPNAKIEIPAKDSVFVFVQCSLEPNNVLNPAFVKDSIYTNVGGNKQKILLAAYGWDAHYYRNVYLPCGITLNDKTKPYVFLDNVGIQKNCTATFDVGIKIYNSANSGILVEGNLIINGNENERVMLTGDKPVNTVKYYPNQWVGIRVAFGGKLVAKYADIHNAQLAVLVDTIPVGTTYNCELESVSLMHCGTACMVGKTAAIKAVNCVFANAGNYTFLGLLGGNYSFKHCTFANFWDYSVRRDAQFAITNTLRNDLNQILATAPLNCEFFNNIIQGTNDKEFFQDKGGSASFTVNIENNFIKSTEKLYPNTNNYVAKINFKNKAQFNFTLDTLSPAKDACPVLSPPINTDFFNKLRDSKPDAGAFEREK